MRILTETPVEYRVTKEVEGKNGKYYLHTFEDVESIHTFYCKQSATALSLHKGDMVNLIFDCTTYNGQNNFMFIDVVPLGKK